MSVVEIRLFGKQKNTWKFVCNKPEMVFACTETAYLSNGVTRKCTHKQPKKKIEPTKTDYHVVWF